MQVKKFVARDIKTAMYLVREALGEDAIILSHRRNGKQIEIVAAVQKGVVLPDPSQIGEKPLATDPALSRDGEIAKSSRPNAKAAPSESLTPASEAGRSLESHEFSESLRDLRYRPAHNEEAVLGFGKQPPKLTEIVARKSPHKDRLDPNVLVNQSKPAILGNEGQLDQSTRFSNSITRLQQPNRTHFEENVWPILQAAGFRRSPIELMISAARSYRSRSDAKFWPETVAETISLVANNAPGLPFDLIDHKGVITVAGASGVGKTTTIAKLAVRAALRHGRDSVAIYSTDTLKFGGHDQLNGFAKALDLTVNNLSSSEDLEQIVLSQKSGQLVLIDTAGIGERDQKLLNQISHLADARSTNHLLVLSATSHTEMNQRVLDTFSHINFKAAVITKIDEILSLGPVLSSVLTSGLALGYLCNGRGLADIRFIDAKFWSEFGVQDLLSRTSAAHDARFDDSKERNSYV